MKLNSISGVIGYASDLERTATFYESLGFRMGKRDAAHLTCYVNWFWVTFIAADQEDDPELRKEAAAAHRGAGLLLYVKVDDLDEYYAGVVANGMKPSTIEPRKRAGNREFVLRDPDGYRLVFFEKK
jgi:catechol 2,3-dioxygenase-like lactoylglutathione lyase family enzyme